MGRDPTDYIAVPTKSNLCADEQTQEQHRQHSTTTSSCPRFDGQRRRKSARNCIASRAAAVESNLTAKLPLFTRPFIDDRSRRLAAAMTNWLRD